MSRYGVAVIVGDLTSVQMERAQPSIYDREIEVGLLYRDVRSGAEHYLIRYPAGLGSQLHRHTAAHTIVVLDGHLRVNDQVVGAGGYCHFPGGEVMWHAPVGGESCLFITIFDGPFDVEPLDPQASHDS